MTDREKVIKGLKYCQSACVPVDCECCPFGECSNAPHTLRITPEVHDAILSLLQAQEPKQARIEGNDMIHVAYCQTCGKVLRPWGARYCYDCGQAVKWE